MRPFLRHGRISSPTLAVLVLVVLAITVDSLNEAYLSFRLSCYRWDTLLVRR